MNKVRRIFLVLIVSVITLFIMGCETLPPSVDTSDNYLKIVNGNEITNFSISTNTSYSINEIPSPVKEGYLFLGWSLKENSTEYLTKNTIYIYQKGTTLYANFEPTKINYFEVKDVGTIQIATSGPITNKQDYVPCYIKVESDNYQLSTTAVNIRLRGNSSLGCPKKSYKLKFDSKVDIFNMGSDKEWALIANYFDPSLIRNFLAYRLAKALGMEFAVDCQFVEVYIDGYNQGLYLLCETVKTGGSRVDIEVDYDETETDIPFLLELDMKMVSNDDPESNGVENIDFFYLNSAKRYPIACKYPKTFEEKNVTAEQYNIIKNYMINVFNACKTSSYASYIDVGSCIDFYLIQEIFMNIDQDYSSVFMYRKQGGKLQFGPVWDFDISTGNCNYVNNYSPLTTMQSVNGGSYLFNSLLKNKEFKALVKTRLKVINDEILPELWEIFPKIYYELEDYAIMDNKIWNTLNQAYWPKPEYLVGLTYYEQLKYLREYLSDHVTYLMRNW